MFSDLSLPVSVAIFIISALVIAYAGSKLSSISDRLADCTGIGEALMGAIFLGATTSLPGITASITAAWDGHASMALSNAIGGIAAQMAFLALADIAYKNANLEHAAASVPNMMQCALLIVILAILMLGMVGPEYAVWGVNPVSPVLILTYIFGMKLVFSAKNKPMWKPEQTSETSVDIPADFTQQQNSLVQLWVSFVILAAIVTVSGWVITRCAETIMSITGISESVVGGIMIAIVTSLPELITSIAAVRIGALTLAVGGVIGGNVFDTLFAAVADIAYREGSIYHAATARETGLVAITMIMTGVILLGLIYRQRHGLSNIGFESFIVLVLYGIGVALLNFG